MVAGEVMIRSLLMSDCGVVEVLMVFVLLVLTSACEKDRLSAGFEKGPASDAAELTAGGALTILLGREGV